MRILPYFLLAQDNEPPLSGLFTSNLDLYLSAHTQESGNVTLFSHGHITSSGSVDLYLFGVPSGQGTDYSGGLNLFLFATENSGQYTTFDLFVRGLDSGNSNLDLYTYGNVSSTGSVDLFINGLDYFSGNFPLYTAGPLQDSGWMNLFLKVHDPISHTDSLPFSLFATINDGFASSLDLFLNSDTSGTPNSYMNLVLAGASTDTVYSSMNLVINGANLTFGGSVDLFLAENTSGLFKSFNLFIKGLGQNAGYFPTSSSMNMIIKSPNEAEVFDLFLKTSDLVSGVMDIYSLGHITVSGLFNLFIQTGADSASGFIDLSVIGRP